MANFPYVGGDGVDDVTGDYDLMYGDGGNDHLISTFSDLNDEIVVSGGDGNDRLDIDDSSDSRALLFGESGNDTIDGGSKTDRLFGGSGNDLLTGWAGNDYLYGGKGNDRLYGYWTASDSPSNDDDNLYGGSGNDQLFGQAGDSDLHGGTGKDRLTGGKGEDEFWFDTKPNSKTNVDKIVDFGLDNDIFSLAHSTFTGLPTGPLAPGMFRFAKVALDGDDHLIYDQEHGLLYFDPDGKGGDPQVLLAKLLNHAALTYADFYVVPV